METLSAFVTDERPASVMLATIPEPGDATVGQAIVAFVSIKTQQDLLAVEDAEALLRNTSQIISALLLNFETCTWKTSSQRLDPASL